jgi:hypothetical protein
MLAAVAIAAGAATVMAAQVVVVAEIAGRPITRDQFRAWLQTLREQEQYAQSVETLTPAGQRRLLERLVTLRLFAEAARAGGAQADSTDDALAARYEQQLLAQMKATDGREYYDAHVDLFRSGGRIKAGHILVKSRAEAEQVLADLRDGKTFAEVARSRSVDSTTARTGGDLGWVSRGVMVKPFEDALFALEAGGVSGVVETGYGFHVLRADAVDEGTLLPYDAVRDLARSAVAAERIAGERARLAERFGAKVYPQRLGEAAR